jgi:CarD family transcriptional regulator
LKTKPSKALAVKATKSSRTTAKTGKAPAAASTGKVVAVRNAKLVLQRKMVVAAASKASSGSDGTKSKKPVTTARGGTVTLVSSRNVKPVVAAGTPAIPVKAELLAVDLVPFIVGDKIVYPGHGVGEVEAIRSTSVGGSEQQFYNIKIIDTGMKVFVPVSQAATVGLRRIVDKKAVEKVYEILRSRDFKIDTQTWNRRFREYSQKIKTGSVFEIAMVMRDLWVLSGGKELSFGEKKMLDMAQNLLVAELALAKARPADKILGELKEIFA